MPRPSRQRAKAPRGLGAVALVRLGVCPERDGATGGVAARLGEAATSLRGLLAGDVDAIVEWSGAGVGADLYPFERQALDADLETVTGFDPPFIGSSAPLCGPCPSRDADGEFRAVDDAGAKASSKSAPLRIKCMTPC